MKPQGSRARARSNGGVLPAMTLKLQSPSGVASVLGGSTGLVRHVVLAKTIPPSTVSCSNNKTKRSQEDEKKLGTQNQRPRSLVLNLPQSPAAQYSAQTPLHSATPTRSRFTSIDNSTISPLATWRGQHAEDVDGLLIPTDFAPQQ